MESLAKEKDCDDVKHWNRSIVNHLYWTAATSSSGDEAVAKWTSVANHLQNVHVHDDPNYSECEHEAISRKWLKPGMTTKKYF